MRSLYVPTRDRPQALLEAVRSHLVQSSAFGRKLEVVVMDGSGDPAESARCRAALSALAQPYGGSIRVAGVAEKRRYVARLIELGIARDVAEWALLGAADLRSTGANRNAILLDGAGERVLACDDDIVGVPAAVPGRREGLTVRAGDPTEMWFFGDAKAAEHAAPAENIDWIGRHEDLLGAPVPPLDVEASFGERLERRLRSPRARIVASWTGFVGDVASSSPILYLLAGGESRERLVASEAGWRAAVASRQVLRGCIRTTIGDGAFFTPGAAALDVRALLPPFPPVTRGEGAVWAQWLRISCEGALVAYLPYVLRHRPPESRTAAVDDLHARAAHGVGMGIMTMAALGAFKPPAGDEATRMRALGRYYQQLSSQDWTVHVRRANAELYARAEAQLRLHRGEPAWWARELRWFLDTMRAAERRPDYAVPTELRELDHPRARTQDIFLRTGKLLEAWPDVMAAARTLRERGVRLAT